MPKKGPSAWTFSLVMRVAKIRSFVLERPGRWCAKFSKWPLNTNVRNVVAPRKVNGELK